MIEIKATNTRDEDFEKAVDKDLEEFDQWAQKKLGQPIVRSERAILKTYLWYKMKEANAPADKPHSEDGTNGS